LSIGKTERKSKVAQGTASHNIVDECLVVNSIAEESEAEPGIAGWSLFYLRFKTLGAAKHFAARNFMQVTT